jgi:hypothetical protein
VSATQKRGRPADSRKVLITAEVRERPDIEKLARAFVMVAQQTALKEKKASESWNDAA